ncbi:TPA: hypothetical protein ACG4NT_000994 [Stenotrophomonas maltophilia]
MAKPRTPTKKARVSGATIKDPGRYKNRSEPANPAPIGTPYKGMTAAQVRVWKECVSNMPWLNAAHRLLLRQVCILAARMEMGEDLSVSSTHALSAMLSKLGATPTDESKVTHPEGDEDTDDVFFH